MPWTLQAFLCCSAFSSVVLLWLDSEATNVYKASVIQIGHLPKKGKKDQ